MKSRTLRRSSLMIAALVPTVLLSACSGGSHPGDHPSGPTGGPVGAGGAPARGTGGAGGATGTGAGMGTGGAGGAGGAASMGLMPVAESAGVMQMRRLTYREYYHSVADLFGTTTDPTGGWSPDVTGVTGFIAPTSVADLQVQLLNQAAPTIVATALASGKLFTAGNLTTACQNPAATAEAACVTQFITGLGLRAYRRPVAAAEQTDLMTLYTTARGLGQTYAQSISAVAQAMIQSPNFLYHWEIGPTPPVVGADGLVPLTQWQIASRLAMALWESKPDDTLLTAAADGQLATTAQITAQITRMLADPRATQSLYSFHQQWLLNVGTLIGDVTSITKSSPLWTPAAAAGVQTEFSEFLSSVYTGDGTLKTLFTAPYSFINHDIGVLYGVQGPATGFAKVMLDPTERAGILTQTGFLASQASDVVDNPIYRGLSIYIRVLCGTIGSPPAIVPPVNFIATGTTRQSFQLHGSNACAAGCHNLFDPPGFAFENYDGMGQWRTTDNSLPVDATGTFTTPFGTTMTFKNAVDLAQQLAASTEAQQCVDRQWSRYMLGRLEGPAELGSLYLALQHAEMTPGFSLTGMVTALLTSKAFTYRTPSPGEVL